MTKYLNFSEDFMEKIISGEKKATLRLGIKDYKPGEKVIIRCGNKVIGRAIIKDVKIKTFEELNYVDIMMDGYESKEDLRKKLEEFYGKFDENALFTQIIFELSEIY